MHLDDGTVVIHYRDGSEYVVCIMRRTPDLFLKPVPVLNWGAFTEQAEAAVQEQGGLQRGQLYYSYPVTLLALVSDQSTQNAHVDVTCQVGALTIQCLIWYVGCPIDIGLWNNGLPSGGSVPRSMDWTIWVPLLIDHSSP